MEKRKKGRNSKARKGVGIWLEYCQSPYLPKVDYVIGFTRRLPPT